MATILISGAGGGLGRTLVPLLAKAGHTVRGASRRAKSPFPAGSRIEWASLNLLTGDGLAEAIREADTVVHLASSALSEAYQTEVEGTRRLIEAAQAAGVKHFFYMSIVGVERMTAYPYYQAKLDAEKVVEDSKLAWTILRATQFHTLIDFILSLYFKTPITFLRSGHQAQPIDVGETAQRIVEVIGQPAVGRLPDIGGPEVLTLGEMAKQWLEVRQMRRLILPLGLPGTFPPSFPPGAATCPDQKYGKMTWGEWLRKRYPAQ